MAEKSPAGLRRNELELDRHKLTLTPTTETVAAWVCWGPAAVLVDARLVVRFLVIGGRAQGRDRR